MMYIYIWNHYNHIINKSMFDPEANESDLLTLVAVTDSVRENHKQNYDKDQTKQSPVSQT